MVRKWLAGLLVFGLAFALPALGEEAPRAQLDGLNLTVMSSVFDSGWQENVPMPGMQFLIVTVRLENPSQSALPLPQPRRLWAVDSSGRPTRPLLVTSQSALPETLSPGRSVQADWVFEIPATQGSYTLYTQDGGGRPVSAGLALGQSRHTAPADETPWLITAQAGLTKAPEGKLYLRRLMALTGPFTEADLAWELNGEALAPVYPVRAGAQLGLLGASLGEGQRLTGYVWYLIDQGSLLPFDPAVADAPAPNALTVTQGDWQVTLHSLKEEAGPKGDRYMVASLTVENRDTRELTVSTALCFTLLDQAGAEVPKGWDYPAQSLDTKLLPGQAVTGEAAFLLTRKQTPDTLRIHLNMLGQPVFIPLDGVTLAP